MTEVIHDGNFREAKREIRNLTGEQVGTQGTHRLTECKAQPWRGEDAVPSQRQPGVLASLRIIPCLVPDCWES